jgi:3-hydroxybutyryl-CoA dehydrogenase
MSTTVAVVGAGTMGHGIAQVAAMAGYSVMLTDARADALDSARTRIADNLAGAVQRGKLSRQDADATIGRISTSPDMRSAVHAAHIVVEAVVEDLARKREVFAAIDAVADAGAVLASNTSSLSIAAIADATTRPERVVGMHFFNPVHIMKLVEIVVHPRADPKCVAAATSFATAINKTPIVVRDSPGFASSRLGVALGLEAMRMVEEGVASAQDIDTAMELGYGHPMGPLRVSDLVGLDVRLHIAEYLHRELKTDRFEVPTILREKVANGELGKKTGRGFYDWR